MARKAARKAGSKGQGRRTGGPDRAAPADLDKAVIDAALDLAARKGWSGLALAEVAEVAGLPISAVHARFPSKQAILAALVRRIDQEVLTTIDADPPEGGVRDRLFDVLMRRLEALEPYRAGLKAIARASACDPLALACGACQMRRSMAAMLEAAGLSSAGMIGLVRVKGLAAIYLSVFRTWLGDEAADHSRTMAALDRSLRRAEGWVEFLGRIRPRAA